MLGVNILPTLKNIFIFISMLSPLLIVFFMVMLSLFNQDLRGLIYLAGILIAFIINIIVATCMNIKGSEDANVICTAIDYPSNDFVVPYSSSVIIAFTIAYLLFPMWFNNNMNYAVIITLFSIFGLDMYTKIFYNCTYTSGPILGGLLGLLLGSIWFALFHFAGFDSLLYFETYSSNRVFCEKPAKQQFKCRVYKNGELLTSGNV